MRSECDDGRVWPAQPKLHHPSFKLNECKDTRWAHAPSSTHTRVLAQYVGLPRSST